MRRYEGIPWSVFERHYTKMHSFDYAVVRAMFWSINDIIEMSLGTKHNMNAVASWMAYRFGRIETVSSLFEIADLLASPLSVAEPGSVLS